VFIFFPENFQGMIQATNICDPQINVTGDTNQFVTNVTCQCGDNVCPNFPSEIEITMVNSS